MNEQRAKKLFETALEIHDLRARKFIPSIRLIIGDDNCWSFVDKRRDSNSDWLRSAVIITNTETNTEEFPFERYFVVHTGLIPRSIRTNFCNHAYRMAMYLDRPFVIIPTQEPEPSTPATDPHAYREGAVGTPPAGRTDESKGLTDEDLAALIRVKMVNIVLGKPDRASDAQNLITIAEEVLEQTVHVLEYVDYDGTLPKAQIEALEYWALENHLVPNGSSPVERVTRNYSTPKDKEGYKQAHYELERDTAATGMSPFDEIRNDYLGVAAKLAEEVRKHRVVIAGGFGCGADFLARKAFDHVAATLDPRVLRINQYTPVEAASRVKSLTGSGCKYEQFLGHAHIFRNFLDPVVNIWSPALEDESELKPARLDEAPIFNAANLKQHHKLFHNPSDWSLSHLGQFMSVTRDPENHSYLILTTSYDTLAELRNAIIRWGQREGRSESIKNIPQLLDAIQRNDIPFWSPLAPDWTEKAERARLSWIGSRLLHAWDDDPDEPPEWTWRVDELVPYACIGSKGQERYRPAFWVRLLYQLHRAKTAIKTLDEAKAYAIKYQARIQRSFGNMHLGLVNDVLPG